MLIFSASAICVNSNVLYLVYHPLYPSASVYSNYCIMVDMLLELLIL